MNQRSTNRSFDAAMCLFKTRQRLEASGIGENEGNRPTLGGVGGLAFSAGLGIHGSELDVAEPHGLVGSNGQRVVGRVAVGLEVGAISGNAGQSGHLRERQASRSQHFGKQRLVTREGVDRVTRGELDGCGRVAVHGSSLRSKDGAAVGGLHGFGLSLGNVEVAAVLGDVAPRSGGLGGHTGLGKARQASSAENGASLSVHGGSKSGPIPAMSNPKPVTSDASSTFFGRIMNGPIPYEPTPAGRAIAAAYKKRQEESK